MATIKKTPMRITPAMVAACGNNRKFPVNYHNTPLIETITEDGADYTYAGNVQNSGYQIADYVATYCKLNKLKVA